ncbi:hypothetical protein IEO21_08262 [Rhodonia placenta]|uniref:WD40 repeat-like protein n=1 Tax=Rhodonia placenta TaxID=104341 RepID=A0A8H7TYZ6_9APHY|nr:hypothetical protein IEO21_08262 [Postia placenta]
MPRDLPGLYWDEEKKRYFPLTSKPKTLPGRVLPGVHPEHAGHRLPLQAPLDEGPLPKRRRLYAERYGHPTWNAAETVRTSLGSSRRSRVLHWDGTFDGFLGQCMASRTVECAYEEVNIPLVYSKVNTSPEHEYSVMAGDAQGWLSSLTRNGDHNAAELNVTSKISSVSSWGTRHVLLYVKPFQQSAAKRGILLPDIETGRGFQVLQTGSDVFAIQRRDNLVYVGARNGSISRFDTRLDTNNRQELLQSRFEPTRSSITHLSVVQEWQLLVSTIRGDLETHDLRFLRSTTPLMRLNGHINSYTIELGIAVDPSENYVFAAGDDCKLRGWSLHSGDEIVPSPPSPRDIESAATSSLFGKTFDNPIRALQVTESPMETCLWAASGSTLHQFWLGQRAVLS